MSSKSSPSKQLSESLGRFHISSPSKLKPYMENDKFQDKAFDSQGRYPRNGRSYVDKLDSWSVNYGTVQQHGVDSENAELPQWKQYMQGQVVAEKGSQELHAPADLVVTSSLSDISLIPTNTFKKRGTRLPVDETHQLDPENNTTQEKDTELDIDPAREALGVFNNVLRHQRSNFFNDDEQKLNSPVRSVSDGYETGSNSSFDSFDPPLSPSIRQSNKKQPHQPRNEARKESPRRPLKLITPEDAGMVFNYKEGVWDQPSATVDVSTSGAQDESSQSKIVSFKLPRTRPETSMVDDTPLSTPKVDLKFLSRNRSGENTQVPAGVDKAVRRASRVTSLLPADTTHNLVDNVTSVSDLDTSFRISRGAVVSALVDAIPRKENWEKVRDLSLERRDLESLVGLDEMAPSVLELNVSHNKLNSLQGVPKHTISLCCSHNRIGTYCRLDALEHLEDVDLSHNALSTNLSLFAACLHLRNINISQNGVTSLQGLSESRLRIDTLNIARNRLIGPLDFADLLSSDQEPNFLTHLRELDLSGNKITTIKNLHLLTGLRVLKLDGNPLETLVGNTNKSLRSLTALGCTALRELGDFPQLRILKLSGESLQIQRLPESLEHLELTGITGASSSVMVPWNILPHMLRKLRLSRLGFEELPPEFATHCPALDALIITDNELQSAANLFERLPVNLRTLDVRRNPLTQFKAESERKMLAEAAAMAAPNLKKIFL